jgi:SAM-dependent methyltransferase
MSKPRAYAERTIAAYRVHAEKAIREWGRRRKPSRFLKRFASLLPLGGRVLDYGCGTGEEMAWLRGRGFQVEGVEGALEFVLAARRRCPGIRILHARFERVPLPPARYDGVWCNAALIHVPPSELARQLEKLETALKPAGWLGLTLAWGRAKQFLRRDWIPGRYLAAYTQAEALALLKGWKVSWRKTMTGDGRSGRWIQILGSCHNRKYGGFAA